MTTASRRLVIWGLIALLVAAGLGYAFRPQAVAVDLAVIETSPLRVTVEEEGQAEVREVYSLSAPISGRLLRIKAEVGDPVTAGETELARIEPAEPAFLDIRSESEARAAVEAARAARDLAQADLTRSQAELAFAESELERARSLFTRGTVSKRTLDQAERAHRVAAAGLLTAQATLDVRSHELEVAEARLTPPSETSGQGEDCECLTLRAPVDGEVLQVLQESETVVQAGQPLVEMGDPRDLQVVVDLLSEDAVKVEPGQAAIISGWGGPDLAALVRRVEPYGYTKVSALGIEEQRVDVLLDLTDPPEDWARLGHGYRVDVAILLHDREVLSLPLGALFREGGDWKVFRLEEGRARAVTVKIGLRNQNHAELLEGLEPGDRVVLYPTDRVVEGAAIEPRS
jgi:HlyD family secretion protein